MAQRVSLVLALMIPLWLGACGSPAAPTPIVSPPTIEPAPAATAVSPTAAQQAPPTASTPTLTAIPTLSVPLVSAADIESGLDSYFGDSSRAQQFSGVVFVARDGQVLYEKAFGTFKTAPHQPITTSTKFRIASVTKQITAALILHLQGKGKLHVHDKICSYLDACPDSWKNIEFHHLMTNTSGLPDTFVIDVHKPHALAEIVRLMQNAPVRANPGGDYSHNAWNFMVLADLIERITGKSYEDYLRETFLVPLGMKDTGINIADSELPGYHTEVDYSNMRGGVDLYSTVEDLNRWTQALDKWQNDPNSEYQPMFQPYVGPLNDGLSYGYALAVGTALNQHYVGHPGNSLGYTSIAGRYLDSHTTVIILCNSGFVLDAIDPYAKIILGVK